MPHQGSQPTLSEAGYLLRLALCLGALLVFRIAALYANKTDLVFDEAQYWAWSRELAFGYFSKPPMIAWIIRGASAICGDGEACLRSVSPVLYTLASLMIYLSGRALYGPRIGFWSAIVFATVPGVSYSSNLITTDVPLVLFWTIALYAWVMLVKRPSMGFAVLLGMAIGLGLLAKQAMIYAFLCIACHAMASREARDALKGGRGIVAALLALALFSPNVMWNAEHGFPTVRHTETNIGWKYPFVHPMELLNYIGAQFGVFGPILFAVLLRGAWREVRRPSDQGKVLLLSFSLPVLALLAVQALLSRTHANWAATAYPAAAIFVTSVMFELNRRILFNISLGLHVAVAVALAVIPAFAPAFARLGEPQANLLLRVQGWRELGEATRKLAEAHGVKAILTDDREPMAELLYYLRDTSLPVVVWPRGPVPLNHFEMTRPYTSVTPAPLLYVTLRLAPPRVAEHFARAELVDQESFPKVAPARTARFYLLDEPREAAP
jgi:4-amino-4-deoxy-L-arabinose transferase-like glycosyltransferase